MKLRVIQYCLFLFVFSFVNSFAQNAEHTFPRDTSFTLFNTTKKVVKDYPFAKAVFPKDNSEINEEKNIVYSTINGRALHLDIFMPKNKSKKYPCVIFVHGGGWRSGDRSLEIPMAQKIAALGYITATVEYRLSPEAKYPAAIYDLKEAIRWLRANASKYNIDTSKIAASGTSSGAHLVSFIGATNGNKKFEGSATNLSTSSNLQCVINIDGILDFTDPAESGKDIDSTKPSVGKLWLGYSFKKNPKIWIEASPLNYVNEFTPPFLFVNSSIPRFHAGRDEFINRLNSFNTYSEVHTIPNTPHPFWLFNPWFEEVYNIVQSFLKKIFK